MIPRRPNSGTARTAKPSSKQWNSKRSWVCGLFVVVAGIAGWAWFESVGAARPDAPRALPATPTELEPSQNADSSGHSGRGDSPGPESEASAPERKPWETPDREVVVAQLEGARSTCGG
jgi:hypothetical protein